MRALHLQYMRLMAAAIRHCGSQPFTASMPDRTGRHGMAQSGFLEIEPAADAFEARIPFCVVRYLGMSPVHDGRRFRRLEDGTNRSDGPLRGRATRRYVRREYAQTHSYALDFWVRDPADDIVSDPRPRIPEYDSVPVDDSFGREPGIADQCAQFVAKHKWFTDGVAPIRVRLERALPVTDPAGELQIYKIMVEISFEDGLYSVEEIPTLDGAILKL